MKRLAILTLLLVAVFLITAGPTTACGWVPVCDPCCYTACYPCCDPCSCDSPPWPSSGDPGHVEPAPDVIEEAPPSSDAVPVISAGAGQAILTLALPPDASLNVNGETTAVPSGRPVFVAPGLEPGRQYTYTLKAAFTRDGQARSVTRQLVVRAGDSIRVNLRPAEDNMPAVAKAPVPSQATLALALPRNARLTVNDEPTAVHSDRPVFLAPGLKPGQRYAYALKATFIRGGKVQSVTRQVLVRAGDKVRVDLTTAAVATAAR